MNGLGTTDNGQRTTDRPEADDPRIVRIGVRWFRMAAEEGLTPYESAVAWKRVAHTLLREATFKVATGHLLRTLSAELLEEIPGDPVGGGRMAVGGALTSDLCPLSSEKGGAA